MRLAVCSTLVLGLAGLAACENAPIGTGAVDPSTVTAPADAGADAASPAGGGPVNTKPDATADVAALTDVGASAPDVAAETGSTEVSFAPPDAPAAGGDLLTAPDATDATDAGPADRAPLLSCAALAAAGKASELKTFLWTYEVGPGGSGSYGRPYDTVTLTQTCELTYQKTILPRTQPPAPQSTTRTVTVGATECAEARAWATNARFLEVLRTGDMCPFGMGNPDDVFEINLINGTLDQRKSYLCPEPTLDAVRACASALVARSFP